LERIWVELVGPGGIGGELYHLVPAGPVALTVLAAEDSGLLVAEWAGAGRRFQDVEEGHVCLCGSVALNEFSLLLFVEP
jgi:hypothetical protein